MTKNATYCDKHVSSQKCIFFVVLVLFPNVRREGIPLPAFWEREYLDLPACGPQCGFINGLVRPTFSINNSRPSRGAKRREADDTKTSLWTTSLGWLPRTHGNIVKLALQKKYTSVMIHVCHSRLLFLSCMYIHDKFMTESR